MGGHNRVAMADLCDLATGLGFDDVRTVLQSGNLVFKGAARAGGALETLFEKEAVKHLGLSTSVIVRTAAEWKKTLAGNPFGDEAKNDPRHLAVIFFKDKPAKKNVRALKDCIAGREYFCAQGRELYAVYPDGFGKSKFTLSLIDRKLETRGTGRGWNTVLKLAKLAAA
jgi:uncharacterized protein (DUF1697 family)